MLRLGRAKCRYRPCDYVKEYTLSWLDTEEQIAKEQWYVYMLREKDKANVVKWKLKPLCRGSKGSVYFL